MTMSWASNCSLVLKCENELIIVSVLVPLHLKFQTDDFWIPSSQRKLFLFYKVVVLALAGTLQLQLPEFQCF